MEQSITRARPIDRLEVTSWAPRPTKVLSMPAFALLTGLASRVASGTRVASRSRASLGSSGKSHAGRRPPRRLSSQALRILLPSQLRAAARRTRPTAKRATVPAPAPVVSTSRCAVHLVSTAHHQHRHQCLLPPLHRCRLVMLLACSLSPFTQAVLLFDMSQGSFRLTQVDICRPETSPFR